MANRLKSKLGELTGPARTDQEAIPIADATRSYWERDMLSLSIPAYRGGRELASEHSGRGGSAPPPLADSSSLRTETAVLPREAYLGAARMVEWRDAVNEVSAEMVTSYPPGIPVLAPGERIMQEALDYLEQVVAAGAFVEGAVDQSLERLRVLA